MSNVGLPSNMIGNDITISEAVDAGSELNESEDYIFPIRYDAK